MQIGVLLANFNGFLIQILNTNLSDAECDDLSHLYILSTGFCHDSNTRSFMKRRRLVCFNLRLAAADGFLTWFFYVYIAVY